MSGEIGVNYDGIEICSACDTPNITHTIETIGIGDSCVEKQICSSSSPEDLSKMSLSSLFTSCDSYSVIRKAWEQREKTTSNMNIYGDADDFDATVKQLTSRICFNNSDNSIETREVAKCLSLCVVLEGRTLCLTESSDEDIPNIRKYPKRYFEPDEIRTAYGVFKQCNSKNVSYLNLPQLKMALDKLAVPQTLLDAKDLMVSTVGDNATTVNFVQFLSIYLTVLQKNTANAKKMGYVTLPESIDVSTVGVSGAKHFFEAKIAQQKS